MGEPMTNGEKPSSAFIGHLTSYPVVSDSISIYKTNPYGAKSLSLATDVYNRFLVPFQPYLQGPYSYVAPYVVKADSLGDAGLSKIDSKFPIVKEETSTLKEKVTNVAFFPLTLGAQGKDYVFSTYSDARQNTGVEEKNLFSKVVAEGKAILVTEYKIGVDALSVITSFLLAKKEEGKKFADSKLNN
jgi:hypothetical protein